LRFASTIARGWYRRTCVCRSCSGEAEGARSKRKVEVTIGRRSDREVEITAGLTAGENFYAQADVKDLSRRVD